MQVRLTTTPTAATTIWIDEAAKRDAGA